jgi:NAD(P)-dependent dehydrogenase (short-subunit alcohol dehydrogenase family)
VLAVNLDGAFFTLREAARHMVERGDGGALVGVSSVSAIHGAPGAQPYAASKAGLLAVMRGLAVELARHQIRANSVIPGWTVTELTENGRQNEKFVRNTTQRTPIRRWGVPEDFRSIGAFLADPTQMYHTGDEIVMDGGYSRF